MGPGCAPGFCAPGLLASVTGAGVCWSSGVVVQAATSAAAAMAVRIDDRFARMASPFSMASVLVDERSPGGLAHVAAGRGGQALLEAPVGRDRGKQAAAARDGGEQDHAAVGREARRFIPVAVGNDLHLLVGEVL